MQNPEMSVTQLDPIVLVVNQRGTLNLGNIVPSPLQGEGQGGGRNYG